MDHQYRGVAQLIERVIWDHEAAGLSPVTSTILKNRKDKTKMELTKTNSDIAKYGEKYRFYCNSETKTIVCTTFYKGKTIRGIAKCNPKDNFNEDAGKRLAYLRCKYKLMKNKFRRAEKAYKDAVIMAAKANSNLNKVTEFVNDIDYQLGLVTNELADLEYNLETKGAN